MIVLTSVKSTAIYKAVLFWFVPLFTVVLKSARENVPEFAVKFCAAMPAAGYICFIF